MRHIIGLFMSMIVLMLCQLGRVFISHIHFKKNVERRQAERNVNPADALRKQRNLPHYQTLPLVHSWKHQHQQHHRHRLENNKPLSLANFARNIPKDKRLLVHLHIGKTGGTSMDVIGPLIAKQSNRFYVGNHQHFDWSFIDNFLPNNNVDVILMLRHPVQRAVSHFYFAQTLPWTRQQKIQNYSLQETLENIPKLFQYRTIWTDGQAGVRWLTGTHTGGFMGLDATQKQQRDVIAENATDMCLLAANRLDSTLWFGLLEDIPRSMELLQHALNLTYIPSFPKANKNHHPPNLTETQRNTLESLMPQDLWLYEYGKRLFEARYQAMETGIFLPPERATATVAYFELYFYSDLTGLHGRTLERIS